ncbi:MAG TPA: tyrosine-type recombinase/integrase [Gemmatimonadaceae bacterium]|nr:tyrosine-type recombinase/integrase [Gemmatimonadaceae bacterium]
MGARGGLAQDAPRVARRPALRRDRAGGYAGRARPCRRCLAPGAQPACKAKGIAHYRQHDWRHTYAVQAVRQGMPLPLIAKQLGHANTIMVQRVYGRFLPEASDYAAYAAKSAERVTIPVTPAANTDRG